MDIFVTSLLLGRRVGPPGSPTAFETKFCWVLAGLGRYTSCISHLWRRSVRKFWEIEEGSENNTDLSPEERAAVSHFKENHRRTKDGRFVVPLPKKPDPPSLGESRSQAVRRFLSLERSLQLKNEFSTFNNMRQEYSDLCHAEPVPLTDLGKPEKDVFYLPIHAVKKESSTTTKIRAVFDASVKSSSGVSLNDLLLVGPRYTLL